MSLINLGGALGGAYGVQGADPNLGDKLAALKQQHGNPDDAVANFLTRAGVDPKNVAFTPTTAREYLNDLMERNDATACQFFGDSLGLNHALLSDVGLDGIVINEESSDWHDVNRAYTALVPEFAAQRIYGFRAALTFDPDVTLEAVEAPPVRHPDDPTKYPPGQVLRIERQVVNGDQLDIEHHYIRIGGLFDDTTPTILDTMQPMTDLTGWSVTEEL